MADNDVRVETTGAHRINNSNPNLENIQKLKG